MVATAAATAAVLFVPASPAVTKTTVTSKGGVVTIQVKVDLIGGKSKTGPTGQPLDEYWEQVVKDTWGQAFDQLPYKNCYKFRLDLDVDARGRNASARDGRHVIHVTAPTRGGWEGAGWEGAPETSRDAKTGDGTRSFEHERDGSIPVNAPPTVVAHEFGHAFGLGDDRQGGQAKEGREGTLMVGGVPGVDPNQPLRIDQNLIDRIGKVIEKDLKKRGKKLPDCESWQGTMMEEITQHDPLCRWSVTSDVQVTVAPDGSASGGGTWTIPAYEGCPGGIPIRTMPFTVTGTRERGTFHITTAAETGAGIDLAVRGNRAEGEREVSVSGQTIRSQVTLECTSCKGEDVG